MTYLGKTSMINRLVNAWRALFNEPIRTSRPLTRQLEIRPGDLVLLETDKMLTRAQRVELGACITEWRNSITECTVVLDSGIRLVIVRQTI
jgi:hypothetical protein